MIADFKQLEGKEVLLTGGTGFIGGWVKQFLIEHKAKVYWPSRADWDLTIPEVSRHVRNMLNGMDFAINCAGVNGSAKFNAERPAEIFYQNTVMHLNWLDALSYYQIPCVSLLSSCGYSEHDSTSEMDEYDYIFGAPNKNARGQGYAKRNALLASQFYHEQFGVQAICVVPPTIYGPGDIFDPEKSKVVGGLISKIVEAGENDSKEISIWGSPATLREFMYVKDLPQYIVLAMLRYKKYDIPLNLASTQEYTIGQLANSIAKIAGFTGKIKFTNPELAGQQRKKLKDTNMLYYIGRPGLTPLKQGLTETIKYYREEVRNNSKPPRSGTVILSRT